MKLDVLASRHIHRVEKMTAMSVGEAAASFRASSFLPRNEASETEETLLNASSWLQKNVLIPPIDFHLLSSRQIGTVMLEDHTSDRY